MDYVVKVIGDTLWIMETKGSGKDVEILRKETFKWTDAVERDGVILAVDKIHDAVDSFVKKGYHKLTHKITFSLWSSKIFSREYNLLKDESKRPLGEEQIVHKHEGYIQRTERCRGEGKEYIRVVNIPEEIVEIYYELIKKLGFKRYRLDSNFNGVRGWYSRTGNRDSKSFYHIGVHGRNIVMSLFQGKDMLSARNVINRPVEETLKTEINRFILWGRVMSGARVEGGVYFGEEDESVISVLKENVKSLNEDYISETEWCDMVGLLFMKKMNFLSNYREGVIQEEKKVWMGSIIILITIVMLMKIGISMEIKKIERGHIGKSSTVENIKSKIRVRNEKEKAVEGNFQEESFKYVISAFGDRGDLREMIYRDGIISVKGSCKSLSGMNSIIRNLEIFLGEEVHVADVHKDEECGWEFYFQIEEEKHEQKV